MNLWVAGNFEIVRSRLHQCRSHRPRAPSNTNRRLQTEYAPVRNVSAKFDTETFRETKQNMPTERRTRYLLLLLFSKNSGKHRDDASHRRISNCWKAPSKRGKVWTFVRAAHENLCSIYLSFTVWLEFAGPVLGYIFAEFRNEALFLNA